MRRQLAATLGAAALLLLASCGQQSGNDAGEDRTPDGSAPDLARGTWVLRTDGHSGADGETTTAHYLMVRPADGTVRTVSMPAVSANDASGDQRALLVDAGHRFALTDTSTSAADRQAGKVSVTSLADGSRDTVDLRAATGDSTLTTDHVAFDATTAGQVRVVSGRAVWTVDLDTSGKPGKAKKEGEIPITEVWMFGGFAPDTGDPYLSSIETFETRPKGYGEDDEQVLRRGDGRVLMSETGRLAGQPVDESCEQVTGFVEKGGRAWEFCLTGTDLTVKVRAPERRSWQTVGPPAEDAVARENDLVLVLPPS